jgi:2'-5' RNA ligase
MKIRAFIAIEMDPSLLSSITQIQKELKTVSRNVRWVKPENIHLTLKFLGDVKMKSIPTVQEALAASLRETRIFQLSLGEPGFFPDNKHPRVVWVGLKAGQKETQAITQKIDDGLTEIGFPKEERDFKAHLTIGRFKSTRLEEAFLNKLGTLKTGGGNFDVGIQTRGESRGGPQTSQTVREVSLFKSTLTSQGPIYEKLYACPLKI